jgi:hypothetical protein
VPTEPKVLLIQVPVYVPAYCAALNAARAVAVKVTLTLCAVAVIVFTPGVAPSVHPPTVAVPAVLVVAFVPVAVPPPEATANVTPSPEIALPN